MWVTNLAAPYRIPVWDALAQDFTLVVGLLENSARLARDTGVNRGADWSAKDRHDGLHEYRTARVRRGEDRHYGLCWVDAAMDLARSQAVLLGGWDSPAYFQLLAQARATGRATVGFYESTLASQSRADGPTARARSWYFRSLDRVVVPGSAARDAVLAMGVDPHRILTGFNAVDSARFRDAPEAAPHAGHRFLYVGQLIDRKNLEAVLAAFEQIAEPADSLTLIGRGDKRAALSRQTEKLGIAQQVKFIDYVPNAELSAYMAEHDTLVLASKVEVWGLVVNEALASGMQAVITKNCGVAPSVAGMAGVYLAAPDGGDLAAAMHRARDEFTGRISNPEILQYTPERFAKVFARAFTEAIAERRGAGKGI